VASQDEPGSKELSGAVLAAQLLGAVPSVDVADS
tara:strand:- start:297 stop:398 length:102 start_codon:yes stop_codon:yes gene_type:complete